MPAAINERAEHIVGEVARVAAHGAQSSNATPRTARARLHHVPEARVVQMRHINHHAALLHNAHHLGAERRKSVGRDVARRDGVFAVPREREHFHARVGSRVQAIERILDE